MSNTCIIAMQPSNISTTALLIIVLKTHAVSSINVIIMSIKN